ncbi:hypothetical protein [Actinopolyspora halophila]|uniref:hypothetical protein n=1 Tax=Actinopolyspora halophila TaxID=1850 RepID=UPI0003682D2E|nr:hypothetical protein [Actinopolyspora halophila]
MTGARFVVTGCARSATMYTAHMLTAAGLDCGHERVPAYRRDTFDLSSSRGVGESSCLAAPFLPLDIPTVHLVRPPLDVIGSLVGRRMLDGGHESFAAFVHAHAPEVFEHPPGVERAAAYWLAWNRMVEPHAHLRWCSTTLDTRDVATLAHRAGIEVDTTAVEQALAATSRRINARETTRIAPEDLGELAPEVDALREHYGLPWHEPIDTFDEKVPAMSNPDVHWFRNKRTGKEWAANPGRPEHTRMTADPTFERIEDEPAPAPKPKRTSRKSKSNPHPGGLDEFAASEERGTDG